MPEIGEVARIVNRLREHLLGKTISDVQVTEDSLVFSGISAENFKKFMSGKKVVDVKQWGKYFWLVMDSPPHPVMHFGMAGWMKIKNEPSAHYRAMKKNGGESEEENIEWPPRFSKFNLQLEGDNNEIAFTDARRLGRIRLVDEKDGNNIRNVPPISANGPDPVLESVAEEWLKAKLKAKKVPVKAFLLDQAILSGIGNWVGDEILYEAKLHPETYTNTLSDEQIQKLHESILYVTKTAVDTEAEQDLFPEHWLMKHRWNKGKKNEGGEGKLPNGERIAFLKVGGRTSAFVPSVQKKGALDKTKEGDSSIGEAGDGGGKRGEKKTVREDQEEKTVHKERVRKRKVDFGETSEGAEEENTKAPTRKRKTEAKLAKQKTEGTKLEDDIPAPKKSAAARAVQNTASGSTRRSSRVRR